MHQFSLQPSPTTVLFLFNQVIRIKADLLVSLCQRQWEGFVSLGVHEIRNIELQKKGHYSLDDLDSLTGIEQSKRSVLKKNRPEETVIRLQFLWILISHHETRLNVKLK